MDSVIQIFISVMCIALFVYVVYLVARERLLLKYSLLWLLLSIVILICALFPGPLYSLASGLGFVLTSNFCFSTWPVLSYADRSFFECDR